MYSQPARKRYRATSGAIVTMPAVHAMPFRPRKKIYPSRIPGAQGEFKSLDNTATADVNSTPTLTLLNGCARGDDINQRTGREIILRSVQINGRFRSDPTGGVAQHLRCLLVYDRQCNAAALTTTQVIVSATTTSPRNLENRRRFKILMDKTFDLSSIAAGPSTTSFRFYRKLYHPTVFNAGEAGTVADIVSGSLYMIYLGTEAAGDTDAKTNIDVRVRFQDK